ncbi:MAG: hypothetical protein LBH02_03625 [Methanocalculaceae archaeon]|jgi:hypothetical protein|nr:hypothetical protein [Methanocalculaceae archaeon]
MMIFIIIWYAFRKLVTLVVIERWMRICVLLENVTIGVVPEVIDDPTVHVVYFAAIVEAIGVI